MPMRREDSAGYLIVLLAFVKFAIQFATAGNYGIFRDELYYLACAQHLDWGYVDQPPLIAFVAWLSSHLFGLSLYGLRFLPAVAGGLLVWVTAEIARELGGGRFAQGFAGFAVIPVPIYLMLSHWLTMNAFEPLAWMMVVWLALRMVRIREPRLWLLIGLVCGIGLENKYSMVLPIGAMLLTLLLTPHRRILWSRWFPAGLALGASVFLPNLIWLAAHNFPFLEFERNSRSSFSQMHRAPLDFIADQAMIMNPLLSPLWAGGLISLLFAHESQRVRFLGWFFLAVSLPLLIIQAKNYYLAPAYPLLFAAGAVALEARTRQGWRWVRGVYAGVVLAAGLILAPFVLPILPVEDFLKYQTVFGGFNPVVLERNNFGLLPQQFADEFGWDDMAKATAKVYATLAPSERGSTAIFANNYGEAAAIDILGPKYGLPHAISNHMSYWLWGTRGYSGNTVIVLGSDGSGDRQHFATVEVAGRAENPLSRPEERFDIYLCRDLSTDLQDLWPRIKKW